MLPALNPRLVVAAGVAILFFILVINTYRLSAAVDRKHALLVECQAANQRLKDAIDAQNIAVGQMRQEAEQAKQRAQDAIERADREAEARRRAQIDLEGWKRQAGEGECEAARRLLQEVRR